MLNWIAKLLTKVEYVDDLKGYQNGRIDYGIPMRVTIEKGANQEHTLAHEMQHARDAVMTLGLAPLVQEKLPMVKLWLETRAFSHQIEVYGIDGIISSLYHNYNLGMSRVEISRYVRNYYERK